MAAFSRRQLASYAVDQIVDGQSPADISKRLAAALIVSKRQKDAELLLGDIAEQLETRGLLTEAAVTSAKALSSSLLAQLAKQIKQATGTAEVTLKEQIDPTVIGGFRVETANRTWDKTLSRQLAAIKGGI